MVLERPEGAPPHALLPLRHCSIGVNLSSFEECIPDPTDSPKSSDFLGTAALFSPIVIFMSRRLEGLQAGSRLAPI